MNTIVIGWETRNCRRSRAVSVWCKNYGLSAITKETYIGELTVRERAVLTQKFEQSFTKSTDKFFFLLLCDSCIPRAVLPPDSATLLSESQKPFELVTVKQNPE